MKKNVKIEIKTSQDFQTMEQWKKFCIFIIIFNVGKFILFYYQKKICLFFDGRIFFDIKMGILSITNEDF
jgi:hypothetical protein